MTNTRRFSSLRNGPHPIVELAIRHLAMVLGAIFTEATLGLPVIT